MGRRLFAALILVLTAGSHFAAAQDATYDSPSVVIIQEEASPPSPFTTLVKDVGGRVDWSADGSKVVFDRLDKSGYFRLWTMDTDGGNQTCISCANPEFPKEHHGNPAWHPSGECIVFQAPDLALKPAIAPLRLLTTSPGAGLHNNLWVTAPDGSWAWQLTHVGAKSGVLHPHFSHDGTKLVWAEMLDYKPFPMGTWVVRIADFYMRKGIPAISRIRTLTPGNLQWYETHGFSPDDGTLLFSGSPKGGGSESFDIYSYDLFSGKLRMLTDRSLEQWDEHAHFTPDGRHIIWMSSMDLGLVGKRSLTQGKVKTEYWVMNADGSGKSRLTYFNEPGHSHYLNGRAIASDISISPKGTYMAGYVQIDSSMSRPGDILLIPLAGTKKIR